MGQHLGFVVGGVFPEEGARRATRAVGRSRFGGSTVRTRVTMFRKVGAHVELHREESGQAIVR